jgi:DNA-binding CsgD family transcriptional regulator
MGNWVTEEDHRRALTAVGDCCEARSRAELVSIMLPRLQMLLGGDEASCSTVLPDHARVTSSYGYPTRTTDLPAPARLWWDRPMDHPWMRHYARTRDDRTMLISDLYSGVGFRKLPYYADFYKPKGVRFAAYAVLTHLGPVVVGVGSGRWRSDFRDRDRDLLNHLRRPLGAVWQLMAAREQLALLKDAGRPGRLRSAIIEPQYVDLTAFGGRGVEFTPAERDVVALLVRGWDNRRIALTLRISIKAVEQHLTHVYRKCAVASRSQLILLVLGRGS